MALLVIGGGGAAIRAKLYLAWGFSKQVHNGLQSFCRFFISHFPLCYDVGQA